MDQYLTSKVEDEVNKLVKLKSHKGNTTPNLAGKSHVN